MPGGAEIPTLPAAFYRRKAARARQVAEGVTTRAMKAKLLEDAGHCDRLDTKADRTAKEAAGFKTRPIDGLVSRGDPVKNVNKTKLSLSILLEQQIYVMDILLRYAIDRLEN